MTVVARFAPSPTGRLHKGHAFSALFAWSRARAAGGRFLLRIEDIDVGRCREEFVDGIREDLAWLGLSWEEPVRRQSEHMGDYAGALARLGAQGVLYPCFCTRRDIADEIALVPDGEMRVINSIDGHMGLIATDPGYLPQVELHLRELLALEV